MRKKTDEELPTQVHEPQRRAFIKAGLAMGALNMLANTSSTFAETTPPETRSVHKSGSNEKKPHIVVVGAGAFGGWTALYLLRSGARVTLIDSWGPGNARASSGGETRIIRGTYGTDPIYTQMAARALQLWRENEQRWQQQLYHRTGVLWMAGEGDTFVGSALPILRDVGLSFEELTAADAAKRYPQINFVGVKWAMLEHDAGYLTARRACEAVLEGFLAEGGEYRQAAVFAEGLDLHAGELRGIKLSDASRISADQFVFACGPWLGEIFPDLLGKQIRPTRQEVFFFGPPPGDTAFDEANLPVWIDKSEHIFYGIPGNLWRGFKVADDTRGVAFEPTHEERIASVERREAARRYMEMRFPRMKGAPLLESRVCQYENTADQNFILDRHPSAANLWLVGGGSGHGFKHGPAMGEMAANAVLGMKPAEPAFSLKRFR